MTDLGFSHRVTKAGDVRVFRHGRPVAALRAEAAARFLERAEGASTDAVQQLCARVTGNYRRGNESQVSAVRKRKGASG